MGTVTFEATNGGAIRLDKLAEISGKTTNFVARNGSVFNLPQLTAIANQRGYSLLFQADGSSSTVNLPNVQSVTATSAFGSKIEFDAANGGTLALDTLTQVGGQTFRFTARGAGSTLRLPLLQSVTSVEPRGAFSVSDSSVINAPQLTELNHVDLTIAGAGSFPTHQLTRLIGDTPTPPLTPIPGSTFIARDNAIVSFGAIQDLSLMDIRAEGGSRVTIPLTQYVGTTQERNVQISAIGSGSVIDMSAMTQLIGQITLVNGLTIAARDGGKIDLSGVQDIPDGAVVFEATGTGSTIDLSQLVSHRRNRNLVIDVLKSGYLVTGGAKIMTPSLLQLYKVNVTVDASSIMPTQQIQTMQEGSITAIGGVIKLDSLIDATGHSFYAKGGGRLSFPATLTNYVAESDANMPMIQAVGKDSLIDFTSLTALTGHTPVNALRIEAKDGGVVDLRNVAVIPGGTVQATADGTGSSINLTSLALLQGTNRVSSFLSALKGGSIIVPNLTVIREAGLKLDTNSSINTAQLTTLTDGYIEADRKNPDLTKLAMVDGSGFSARNGAVIQLPNVTTYSGGDTLSFVHNGGILATGFGSAVKFPALTTVSGNTFVSGGTTIKAENGGLVDMPLVETIATGNTKVEVIGSQSHVNLSNLSSYAKSSRGESYIDVQGNSRLTLDPVATTFTDVKVTLSSNADLNAGELMLQGGSMLVATGAVKSSIINQGIVGNGSAIASLTINGNYTQAATGKLEVDIRDTNPTVGYDRYNVLGNATVGGTLLLRFTSGFRPAVGNTYTIFTAGTLSGSFVTVETVNLDPVLGVRVNLTSNNATVEIVPAN